jgi:hypothetical protein
MDVVHRAARQWCPSADVSWEELDKMLEKLARAIVRDTVDRLRVTDT